VELLSETPTPEVADVHRRGRRGGSREQPALGCEVLVHRPVEVEVVLAQVREDERVEADAIEPVQDRSV
jgi:hypothetical protein